MKAVVLEKKDGMTAVLREDGTVLRIETDKNVGETIELTGEIREFSGSSRVFPSFSRRSARMIAAAAAALLLIFTGAGTYGYMTVQAASYVTVDSDTSMEFVLNRRDQVIGVNVFDETGETVWEKMRENGFSRCTLSEALLSMQEARAEVFGEDAAAGREALYCITTGSERQRDAVTAELETWIDRNIPDEEGAPRPAVIEGTMEDRETARESGMSTGRYLQDRDQPDHQSTSEEMEEFRGEPSQSTGKPQSSPESDEFRDQTSASPDHETPAPGDTGSQDAGSEGGRSMENRNDLEDADPASSASPAPEASGHGLPRHEGSADGADNVHNYHQDQGPGTESGARPDS